MKKVNMTATGAKKSEQTGGWVTGADASVHPSVHTTLEVNTNIDKKRRASKSRLLKAVDIKKASCYLPIELWIKYKAFEFEQVKNGNNISLNGLIVKLLEKKLKDQKVKN